MGVKKQLRFGPGGFMMFKPLRRARVLRGTPLDIFGYARVRKIERSSPSTSSSLTQSPLRSRLALHPSHELARLPDVIRGYEELKESRVIFALNGRQHSLNWRSSCA